MITVSPEFTAAVDATVRYPVARVDILWTDPFVNSGMTVTPSNYAGQGGSVVRSFHDPQIVDLKRTTPHKYMVLDGTCTTDGTFYVGPSTSDEILNNQFGWYSHEVCDETGVFETPPEVTVEFADPRPVQVIVVTGEPTIGQWPTSFDIYIYDEDGIEIFHNDTPYEATQSETVIDLSDENLNAVGSMKLVIYEWSEPDTISKIVEFFGVVSDTFTGSEIVSVDILEEREVGTGTLPTGNISSNELDIELENIRSIRTDGQEVIDPFFPDNSNSLYHSSITPNVRITPYLGFRLPNGTEELVRMGTFWTTDWNVNERDYKVSVGARDRLELLRQVEFRLDEILVDYTLMEIAEYILQHARSHVPMNDLEWTINSSLDDYQVPYAWFGKMNYMEAIAKIAEACMGHAYMSRDDILIIDSYSSNDSTSHDYQITRDQYFDRNQPSDSNGLKNRIVVPVTPYEPDINVSEIKTSDAITVGAGTTEIVNYLIEWGDEAVLEPEAEPIEQSGVTMYLDEARTRYYPWGCYATFIKWGSGSGTFRIRVNGRKMANGLTNDVILEDADSIALYGKREFKYRNNPLMQSDATANSVAAAFISVFANLRRDITLSWRGNPACEIGDVARVPVYTPNSTGVSIFSNFATYRNRFKFDGELRCETAGRKGITI